MSRILPVCCTGAGLHSARATGVVAREAEENEVKSVRLPLDAQHETGWACAQGRCRSTEADSVHADRQMRMPPLERPKACTASKSDWLLMLDADSDLDAWCARGEKLRPGRPSASRGGRAQWICSIMKREREAMASASALACDEEKSTKKKKLLKNASMGISS